MSRLTTYLSASTQLGNNHMGQIYALRVSARYLVSGSIDTTVRVWSKESGDLALPPLHGDIKAAFRAVEISEELDIVLGGDTKGNITV